MTFVIGLFHFIAGAIVLAEALNKLERTDPAARGLSPRARLVEGLKALAWFFLSLGAGGAVAAPLLIAMGFPTIALDLPHSIGSVVLMRLERPTVDQLFVLVGFAVLIVRTRLKEG